LAGDKLLLFNVATEKWSELVVAPVGALQWSVDSDANPPQNFAPT
jgi:hypothetical protein